MKSPFALTFAATSAAMFCAAAIVAGNAYADDITIDTTPFVSTRTRAEVKAELIAQPQLVRDGGSEWAMQYNQPAHMASGYTRQEALSDYKAARQEVSAFTSEDSGSSYLMRHATPKAGRMVVGSAR